jgi:hypothetical protein
MLKLYSNETRGLAYTVITVKETPNTNVDRMEERTE